MIFWVILAVAGVAMIAAGTVVLFNELAKVVIRGVGS